MELLRRDAGEEGRRSIGVKIIEKRSIARILVTLSVCIDNRIAHTCARTINTYSTYMVYVCVRVQDQT